MMDLRLARKSDLPQLKAMYRNMIENMAANQIDIWDDIYPCDFFAEDIANNRLYILTEDTEILSAFALCRSNAGEPYVKWTEAGGRALYIDRFGVNTHYLRKGIGSMALQKAIELAGKMGARYLRLFVVDINTPAINLYVKNHFKKAEGIYIEKIDENFILHEFGFEIQI